MHYRGALLFVVACCTTVPLFSEAAWPRGQHADQETAGEARVVPPRKQVAKQLLARLEGLNGIDHSRPGARQEYETEVGNMLKKARRVFNHPDLPDSEEALRQLLQTEAGPVDVEVDVLEGGSGQLLSLLSRAFESTTVVEDLASLHYHAHDLPEEPFLYHMKQVSKTLSGSRVARPRFTPLALQEQKEKGMWSEAVLLGQAVHANASRNWNTASSSTAINSPKMKMSPIWDLLRSLYMPEVVDMPNFTDENYDQTKLKHERLFWNGSGDNFKMEISKLLQNFQVSLRLKTANEPRSFTEAGGKVQPISPTGYISYFLTAADLFSEEGNAGSPATQEGEEKHFRTLVAKSLARLQATSRFHSHALFEDGASGEQQIPRLLREAWLTTDVETFQVSKWDRKTSASESSGEMSGGSRDVPLKLVVALQPTVRHGESGEVDRLQDWQSGNGTVCGQFSRSYYRSRTGADAGKEQVATKTEEADEVGNWWLSRRLRLSFFLERGSLVKWEMANDFHDRLTVEPMPKPPPEDSSSEGSTADNDIMEIFAQMNVNSDDEESGSLVRESMPAA